MGGQRLSMAELGAILVWRRTLYKCIRNNTNSNNNMCFFYNTLHKLQENDALCGSARSITDMFVSI